MFSLSLRRNQPHQHGRRSLVREIPCKGDVFTVRFNVQRQLRALRVQQLGRHRHLDFRVDCRGNTATLKADVQDLLAIFQRAHVQRQFPGGQAAFSILRFCRRIGNACKGNAAPSTTHQAKGQLQHVLIVRQQLVTDNRTCNVANISAAGAAAFRAIPRIPQQPGEFFNLRQLHRQQIAVNRCPSQIGFPVNNLSLTMEKPSICCFGAIEKRRISTTLFYCLENRAKKLPFNY